MGRQKSFKATFPHVNKPGATCRNIYVRRKRYAKSSNLISFNSLSILLIVKYKLAIVVSTLLYRILYIMLSFFRAFQWPFLENYVLFLVIMKI